MNIRFSPTIDYFRDLNADQLKIVKEAEGPCLILAGAGSGKTRVLVYRVCYLIEQGVDPSAIMLVTFTNKAAREMINRIQQITGFYPKNLYAGTFHHVGNYLLRSHADILNLQPNYIIIDEEDSISIIKDIMNNITSKEDFPAPAKIKNILSLSVNTAESIKDVINTRMTKYSPLIPQVEAIFKEYQKRKNSSNLLDFDDILVFWHRLMKNKNEGEKIAEQFRYILVDEYHDTNKLQSFILYQLAKIHKNITVVGDDSQSIYSFRGATINNILEFPKIYHGAKTFYLTTNYRSTPQILNLANSIISHNKFQFHKKLKSVRESGIKPVLVRCEYARDEAFFVSQRIIQLIGSGIAPSDIGVLFRSRYQSAQLEIEINKLNIPYIIRGGLRFFEQAHIKDTLAYFKVIENFTDRLAWKRIFAVVPGIGEKTAESLMTTLDISENLNDFFRKISSGKQTGRIKKEMENIFRLLDKICNTSISEGIDCIIEDVYLTYLEKKYKDFSERKEDIEMLKTISLSYSNLADFLSESSLQEYAKGEQPLLKSQLVLSTIHQAKGLEWKIVFIIGVSENHFPHPYSKFDIKALEEERRIFYVGVTRAKEDIYISYYTRDFYGLLSNKKSIFIEDIPRHICEEWEF